MPCALQASSELLERLDVRQPRRDEEYAEPSAGSLEEFASRRHDGLRADAARLMAATISGYVPQRQTLPFIARTMSSVLGDGVRSSSATPAMIIPDVQ